MTYQFLSLFHVGTLQTGNDGGTKTHVVDDVDQTLGDSVAADDTTEDVNEDGSDLGVAGDELESGADGSRSGTTTDIQEVSGASSVQLDDVHGGHGETSTVDYITSALLQANSRGSVRTQASNVTIKLDEVQSVPTSAVSTYLPNLGSIAILSSLDLVGVLLGVISPGEDLLLSEFGVVVESELSVHSQHLVVRGL